MVARRRLHTNPQPCGVTRLLDNDGGLRCSEPIVLIRVRPVPQRARGDISRRSERLELGEESFDANRLGGINQRFGQLPGPIGALGPNLRLCRVPNLHTGHHGGFEAGQDFAWTAASLPQVMLLEQDEGKQRDCHDKPSPCVPGIHAR